jgi:molybdopterin-guanine dinucleotide biosynthesis protein A
MLSKEHISGVILAGGQGSRLSGEDKGLIEVGGQPMIKLVLSRFSPQVSAIMINANRNLTAYASYGFPVVEDAHDDFAGPLAGISAALDKCATPFLATVPCDAPFLPTDVVARLAQALAETDSHIAIARGGDRPQPAFILINLSLTNSLDEFLADGGRKISTWYRAQNHVEVDFGEDARPFSNVNTPEDLADATAHFQSNHKMGTTPS